MKKRGVRGSMILLSIAVLLVNCVPLFLKIKEYSMLRSALAAERAYYIVEQRRERKLTRELALSNDNTEIERLVHRYLMYFYPYENFFNPHQQREF
jgi:hypothetical protein